MLYSILLVKFTQLSYSTARGVTTESEQLQRFEGMINQRQAEAENR